MEHDTKHRVHYWNRKITNACWLTVLFAFVIQSINVFVVSTGINIYVYNFVILPTIYMLIIMICCELFIYFFKPMTDYINITASILLAGVLVWTHHSIPPVHGSLFLPFILSLFYFKKSRVIFACIATFIVIFFIYRINPYTVYRNPVMNLITASAMILLAYFIVLGVLKRGTELLGELRTTMNAKKELLIQNVWMDRLSKMDGLTNCYNHKSFHEYLEQLIGQSESNDLSLHLAIMDIDNFKKINDTYGHWVGDIVLQKVALMIKEAVDSNDLVFRYGGEEFAIIFTEKTKKECYTLLENIRLQLANTLFSELNDHSVTVSIGLQHYAQGGGKESLFKDADHALYISKKTGKNKISSK
jgi:diguanylate cyclase (GGDEF)-like protein